MLEVPLDRVTFVAVKGEPAPILSSNAPAYKGAVAYQVRLTASGAAFTVDDVYFDPYSSK